MQRSRRHRGQAEQLEARELLSVITVDALSDVSDPDDGQTTLREAVAMANADPTTLDTITFDESFDFDKVKLTQGQLNLSGNLVIDGSANNLMRIDQGASTRVITVEAGASVELRNLIVQGGYLSGGAVGAGILNHGDLTLTGSLVGGNVVNYSLAPSNVFFGGGAGIYNSPTGDLDLVRSSVGAVPLDLDTLDTLGIDPERFFNDEGEPNTPYLVGPNVSRGIGGGILNEGTMTLTDSSVQNNRASFGGGGIFNAGQAVLVDSTVTENLVGIRFTFASTTDTHELGYNGGGIFNAERIPNRFFRARQSVFHPWQYSFGYRSSGYSGDPNLRLTGSVVSEQSAQFGAGIFNEVADLEIVQSTISDNTTTNQGQDGLRGGAGLFVASGEVTIDASTFSNNTSLGGGKGGAIHATDNREVLITSSTLSGNYAYRGGAIYVDSTTRGVGRPLTVAYSTITNNDADQGGGVWVEKAGREAILGSIVAGNTAAAFPNIAAAGGIVRSAGSNLIGPVLSSEFASRSSDLLNVADAGLGSLGDFGGPTETHALLPGSPALNGLPDGTSGTPDFDQRGLPRIDGPALDIGSFEAEPPASLQVDTLSDVVDGFYGPGDLSLREALLWAKELPGPDSIGFADSLIADIQRTDEGLGTIVLKEKLVIADDVSIVGPGADVIAISGNRQFGVVQVLAGANVTIHGVTIRDGRKSNADGAGIENFGNLRLTESVVTNNATVGSDGLGAGVMNQYGSTFFMEGSTVQYNTAAYAGGGVYFRGDVRIVNSTISNNTARQGGGLYGHQGTAEIINSTIVENSATEFGGGVRNWQTVLTTANSIFANNSAPDSPEWRVTYGDRQISLGNNFIAIGTSGFTDGANNDIVGSESNPLDPKLGTLSSAGSKVPLHRPLPGSPLIDAGGANDFKLDQLDTLRTEGGSADIGAAEFVAPEVPDGPIIVSRGDGLADGYFGADELHFAEAIILAGLRPGPDEIRFSESLAGSTIRLSGAEILIDTDVSIIGPEDGLVTIDAEQGSRVFDVASGTTAEISRLILRNGATADEGGAVRNRGDLILDEVYITSSTSDTDGGAIFNSGTLELHRTTVADNNATRGGGVFNSGELTIANTTLSGNSATISGGNIHSEDGLTQLNSSTVTLGSSAKFLGGGIYTAAAGRTTLKNTIVARNYDDTAAPDITNIGSGASYGGNLIGAVSGNQLGFTPRSTDQVGTTLNQIDPLLTELVISSSDIPLHALLPASPAIDAGVSGWRSDQRGVARPLGSGTDVGAVEQVPVDLDGPLVVDTLGTELNGDYSPGDLNFREAILLSNALDSTTGVDVIEFSPQMIDEIIASQAGSASIAVPATVPVNRRGYEITGDLIIKDPAAHRDDVAGPEVLTILGNGEGSLFDIRADVDVTIEGLRLAGGGWFSGAIYSVGANVTLQNVLAENNDTVAVAGERGSLTIIDSVIRANEGGVESNGTDLTVTRSVITDNSRPDFGGGVWIQDATLAIDRSEISQNTAGTQGGGIYLGAQANATIAYTTISTNTATDDTGGGIFTQPTAVLDLENVTLAENVAGRAGGGLYVQGATDLTNTLLGGNEAPESPDGWGTITALNSLAQTDGFLPSGNGNIQANPHIGALADNGGPTRTHKIRPGSPAIDSGLAGLAIVDQRGYSLVDIASIGTNIPDIGAYEIQSVGSSSFSYAVYDQSQFGPGEALTYGFGFDDGRVGSSISTDPKFLGFTFDTGNLKAGKITDGKIRKKNKYGGEINADFSGKLGFDLGFFVNSGSLDVAFRGDYSYVVDVTTDDGGSRGANISSYVNVNDGSLYTVSPKVGAYADLVMQLEAEVSATGCFIGCVTKDFIDLDFDKTVELFSMNRQMEDFFGRAMFFGIGEIFVQQDGEFVDANGGVFARASNGEFYDIADETTPIEFYEFRNGQYEVLDRAPVVPFLDGDIRYVSVQLIVEDALRSAATAVEFKRIIDEQIEKRKAARQTEDAREQLNQASNDLNRLHDEREAAIAARDNADTAGDWVKQQREVERLDAEIPRAEDRVIEANREKKRVEDEVNRNNEIRNGKRSLRSPTPFIQVDISEAEGNLLGAQADLVVGLATPAVAIGKRVGGMQVTIPDINLRTNTTDSTGALVASTDSFPAGSELDDKRQLANLQVDIASLLGTYFGLPLGEYNVSLGPLSLDVQTVSYNLGPQLNVTQDVKAEPVIEGLTYQFFTVATGDSLDHDNDPTTPDLESGNIPGSPLAIDVEIDGVLFENQTEITFEPGQDVRVLESVEPVLVRPIVNMDTRVTNDIGLEVALKGEFEAFALALSAFGQTVVNVDPLLTHSQALGTVDLGSVFKRTFEIDDPQSVEMASFTLFESLENGRTAATALQPSAPENSPNRIYFRESMPAEQHVFVRVDMLESGNESGAEDRFYETLIVTPLEGEVPETFQVTDDRLTVTPLGSSYRISGITAEMLRDSSFVTFAMRFGSAGTNKFRTQRTDVRAIHPTTAITDNVASIDDAVFDQLGAATVLTTDIDDDGRSARLTDGLLLTRYLEGKRGDDLVSGVIGADASRRSADSIVDFIEGPLTYEVTVSGATTSSLDFDGNGFTNGIDAKLFRRYLDGLRGEDLVDRAIGRNAVRTTGDEIVEFIERGRSTATRNDSQFDQIEQTTEDIFNLAEALEYSEAKEGSTAYSAYAPTSTGSVQEYKLHKYRNWATFTEVYYKSIAPANLLSIEVEDNPIEFSRRRDDLLRIDENDNGTPDVLESGQLDDDLINRTYQARLGVSEPLFVKAPDGVGHKLQLLTGQKFASVTIDRRVGGNLLLGDEFDLFLYRDGDWYFEATISEQQHAVRDGYLVYNFDRPVDRFQIYATKPLSDETGGEANRADTELLTAIGVQLVNPNRVAEKPRLQVRRIANRRTVTTPAPISVTDAPHAEEVLTSETTIARSRQNIVVNTATAESTFQMVSTTELRLQGNDTTNDVFLLDGAGGPFRSRLQIDGGFRSDEIQFVSAGTELNLADAQHEISGIELIDTRGTGRNSLIIDLDVVRDNDPVDKTLRVIRNSDDKFVRRAGWKRDGEQIENGLTFKRWIQQDALLLLATDDPGAGAVAFQQPQSSDNHQQTDQFFASTREEDDDLFGTV